jgi:trans-aconitate 2-methyltransferase
MAAAPQKPAGYTGTWDPNLYLRFAAYRARPAEDLLPRLTIAVPGPVYDLGCGPGTLTRALKDKWPDRQIIGVDSSAEMLTSARQRFGTSDILWREGDIAAWTAQEPAALLFSNAALHWLSDHTTLFPRLMRQVRPGGLFAVQVPMTGQARYQGCIRNVKNSARWRSRLAGVEPHEDPQPVGFYYDLLAPLAADIDVWETDYHHVLEGEHPVTAWMSGTGLVPFLSVLSDEERVAFLADYDAATAAAYPRQIDGKVLFTMRRLFIVATRASSTERG